MEYLQTAYKISGQSGEFLDSLEDFLLELKVSRDYGRFQTDWKISGNSGRFWDSLGNMLLKHMKPERNAIQTVFTGEMHID